MALLCTQVASDGLRCQEDWPHCVSYRKCVDHGCFWRRFHMDTPSKQPPGRAEMMPLAPPRNTDLI